MDAEGANIHNGVEDPLSKSTSEGKKEYVSLCTLVPICPLSKGARQSTGLKRRDSEGNWARTAGRQGQAGREEEKLSSVPAGCDSEGFGKLRPLL